MKILLRLQYSRTRKQPRLMDNRFITYRASLTRPNEFRAEVTQAKQTNQKDRRARRITAQWV